MKFKQFALCRELRRKRFSLNASRISDLLRQLNRQWLCLSIPHYLADRSSISWLGYVKSHTLVQQKSQLAPQKLNHEISFSMESEMGISYSYKLNKRVSLKFPSYQKKAKGYSGWNITTKMRLNKSGVISVP